MPKIHKIGSVEIRIYRRGEHPPPHVHVDGPDASAQVAIADGSLIQGFLPPKLERSVREWLKDNRQTVLAQWDSITGL